MMTNYSIQLVRCRCVECGASFGCIRPVWYCERCDRKLRERMTKKKDGDGK